MAIAVHAVSHFYVNDECCYAEYPMLTVFLVT
jgi:hypothetical protein